MPKVYLYARVSTLRQRLNRQIASLTKQYPNGILITEKFSGATIHNRPEFERLINKLVKPEDKIVVESCSRFSRNTEEAMELYERLVFENNVVLEFQKEPQINSDVYKKALQDQQIDLVDNEIANIYIEATNKVIRLILRNQIEECFKQAEIELLYLRSRIKEGIHFSEKKSGREIGSTFETQKSKIVKKIIQQKSRDFDGTFTDRELITYINGTSVHITEKTYYKYKKQLREKVTE